eukprot:PhM_4_TR7760/c0_g1_i1/m.70795
MLRSVSDIVRHNSRLTRSFCRGELDSATYLSQWRAHSEAFMRSLPDVSVDNNDLEMAQRVLVALHSQTDVIAGAAGGGESTLTGGGGAAGSPTNAALVPRRGSHQAGAPVYSPRGARAAIQQARANAVSTTTSAESVGLPLAIPHESGGPAFQL